MRVRAWRLIFALGVGALLVGCSEPEGSMTDAEFFAHVAETRASYMHGTPGDWEALLGLIERHAQLLQQEDRDLPESAGVRRMAALQIDEISFGEFPRPGLERGLRALERLESERFFVDLATTLRSGPLAAPWDQSRPAHANFTASPHLGGARGLQRTLRARARVAAVEADSARLLESVAQQLALARASGNRALAIDYSAAVAAVATVLRDLRQLALEGVLDGAVCDAILELLDRPLLPPAAAVLETERAFSLTTYREVSSELGIRLDSRRWVSEVEAMHASARDALSRPRRGRHAPETANEAFAALLAGASDEESLIGIGRLGVAQVVDNERQHRLELAATVTMLLLESYRQNSGEYPASLDAVGAPPDPITGAPFVYRLTPGHSEGLAYALYSTGADGQDDGGIEKAPEGLAAPGPDDTGFDVVFTKPRFPVPD